MKASLKKFYEYYASDEELMTYVRLNGEWNEESFCKMRKLVREVMADYAEEDYYPKKIILYFMLKIVLAIIKIKEEESGNEETCISHTVPRTGAFHGHLLRGRTGRCRTHQADLGHGYWRHCSYRQRDGAGRAQ